MIRILSESVPTFFRCLDSFIERTAHQFVALWQRRLRRRAAVGTTGAVKKLSTLTRSSSTCYTWSLAT